MDPDDHGLHRHGGAADGHPAPALLRQGAGRGRARGRACSSAPSPWRSWSARRCGAASPTRTAAVPRCWWASRASAIAYVIFGYALTSASRCSAVPLPPRAGRGRRHGERDPGLRRRLHRAAGPREGARLALGRDQRRRGYRPGARLDLARQWGVAGPGCSRPALCVVNIAFAWRYLTSRATWRKRPSRRPTRRSGARSRDAIAARRHALRRAGVAADLDLRHRDGRVPGRDVDARALPRRALRRDGEDDRLLLRLHRRDQRADARADPRPDGGPVRRGAAVALRVGAARHGHRVDGVHAAARGSRARWRRCSAACCRRVRWRCCRTSRSRSRWRCCRSAPPSPSRASRRCSRT